MSEATLPIAAAGRTPPAPIRLAQAVALKLGRLAWPGDSAAGTGMPRPLVRVDEFPHANAFDSAGRFGTDAFRRFHAVLAEAGVAYLLAVPPRVSRDYLDPEQEEWRPLDAGETAVLEELREDERVTFALHGLDHRTRHASPRRHSELCGLSVAETEDRIDLARSILAELGVETPVFVPPFNRFDNRQYDLLAARFEVICGGPESIRLLGFRPMPVWHGGAVYLPSYAPLYGRAANVLPGIERMIEAEQALWAPITLHWGWELEDDFASLRRLCERLTDLASDWDRLLSAIAASRRP